MATKQTTPIQRANTTARKATGAAVAELFLKTLAEQGGKLLRYLGDLSKMDNDARKEFRTTLDALMQQRREELKELRESITKARQTNNAEAFVKLSAEHNLRNRTFNSFKVRVSEAVTFAKACDAGYQDYSESDGYHKSVAKARMFNAAKAGAAAKSGRRVRSAEDMIFAAVRKVIENGFLKVADAQTVLDSIGAKIKAGEVKPIEDKVQAREWGTPAEVEARKIGPTQRKERRTNKGTKTQRKNAGIDVDRRTHEAPANVQ